MSEDDVPAGVTAGEYALAVETDGDSYPMIENRKRVDTVDFDGQTHLQAHVLAQVEGTDSDPVFQFRLHHTATPAAGNGDGNGNGGENGNGRNNGGQGNSGNSGNGNGGGRGKDVLVEESEEIAVQQLYGQQIRWDLREVDDDVLKTANRLEIVWYLEDHPPDGGHRGRTRGSFEYRGLTVFDDIRVVSDGSGAEVRASQEKKRALHREHGMIVEREIETDEDGNEVGTLVFSDGTEISYEFEVLDDGTILYTLDGEHFVIGGGSDA